MQRELPDNGGGRATSCSRAAFLQQGPGAVLGPRVSCAQGEGGLEGLSLAGAAGGGCAERSLSDSSARLMPRTPAGGGSLRQPPGLELLQRAVLADQWATGRAAAFSPAAPRLSSPAGTAPAWLHRTAAAGCGGRVSAHVLPRGACHVPAGDSCVPRLKVGIARQWRAFGCRGQLAVVHSLEGKTSLGQGLVAPRLPSSLGTGGALPTGEPSPPGVGVRASTL